MPSSDYFRFADGPGANARLWEILELSGGVVARRSKPKFAATKHPLSLASTLP